MVIKNLTSLCFFLVLLINQTLQTIYITQPAVTTFEKNELPYCYANFGVIHYNKPMSYEVVVSNSTLCDDDQTKIEHFKKPTFLVVSDKGYCSFPSKALKAQELGAQGIIFGSFETDFAIEGVVLADDGEGRKVKIQALFISPQSMQALSELTNPKIKVNFPIKKSSKSHVTLFLDTGNRQNYIFLRNFKDYYLKVKDNIKLFLVFHTIECQFCSQSECILQNKCCSFDSENYLPGSGRYIVQEQFRQYKIFKHFQSKGNIEKWFEYMNLFDLYCDKDWINSESCSKKMLGELGVHEKLKSIDEFDTMMAWRRAETKTGVFHNPEVSVNGVRHSEMLTPASTFTMICQSLSNPPDSCSKTHRSPQGNKSGVIAGIVISVIVLVGLAIYCYHRAIKGQLTNDMSSRVNELVAKYASKVSDQQKKRKDKFMQKMTEEI